MTDEVKRLVEEKVMRPINADAADVEEISCFYGSECRLEDVKEWLDGQPTIDAEPVPKWISVKDRLPENEKAVLAYVETRVSGRKTRGHVVKAFYTDGKSRTDDSAFEWDTDYLCDYLRYEPENDQYYVPEGWWESVRYSDEFSAIDDFVTHWMPLPEPPEKENGCTK